MEQLLSLRLPTGDSRQATDDGDRRLAMAGLYSDTFVISNKDFGPSWLTFDCWSHRQ